MIPENRPVIGSDLEDIRIMNGMSVADACWLFGMSPTKWTYVAKKGANQPVSSTLALLARALDRDPPIRLLPEMPNATEISSLLNGVSEVDKKRLAIISGNEACGGYRWLVLGTRQPAELQRLFYCLKQRLLMAPKGRRVEVLADWFKTVENEARARGITDIFRTGSWTPDIERQNRKKKDAGKAPTVTGALKAKLDTTGKGKAKKK